MKIGITNHAIKQFKNRLMNDPNFPDCIAKSKIVELFKKSEYISDSNKGILFRNRNKGIEFIVKSRTIITLFPIKRKE